VAVVVVVVVVGDAVLVVVVVVVGTLVAGVEAAAPVSVAVEPPLELPQAASTSPSSKRGDLLMFRCSRIR
jgi:hypothetical protein